MADQAATSSTSRSVQVGIICGAIGVAAAVWAFWLVVPGIILGAVAIGLGWRAKYKGRPGNANVAIALGIVAVLAVPSVLVVVDGAEDWGRTCALDPDHDPNC